MTVASTIGNLIALLVMPLLLVGVINRVKARWSGRRGAPLLQPTYDVVRLLRKGSVYSTVATPIVRIAPMIVLVTAIASACVAPLLGSQPLAAFDFDFVWFAYVWGLGRIALMLGALDTGSSFEGMGAAREATFAVLLEPVLFLVVGALCLHGGARSLHLALVPPLDSSAGVAMWIAAVVAMTIVVQVEAARMPVDDPSTHLELTMVHEVMVLDHAGPELAVLQLGSALKLFVGISVIATLLNPWAGSPDRWVAGAVNLGLCVVVAIAIGLVESLTARLKLRAVPAYVVIALVAGGIALLAVLGRLEAAA